MRLKYDFSKEYAKSTLKYIQQSIFFNKSNFKVLASNLYRVNLVYIIIFILKKKILLVCSILNSFKENNNFIKIKSGIQRTKKPKVIFLVL